MIQCIIVDDEPLAREGMAHYVREINFLSLVGICENPLELMQMMDQKPIDLLFLDIQMPKMNGIEFLKMTKTSPMVIITTAYPSYALESFQLSVLDYLLKPITFERFLMAAQKAKDYYQLLSTQHTASAEATDYFFIKCENKYEKIYFDDILFIQGWQNYIQIYTQKGKYITLLSLKSIEQNLNQDAFMRVHKSYLVSISKIDSIESYEISIQSHRIPISRNYREQVIAKVVQDKLWRR